MPKNPSCGCLKIPLAAGAAKKHFGWMPFFFAAEGVESLLR
jgi:hypothetical protein